MQLETGTTLAHYEILSPLGKGGMGEVYRARDTKLGREVAIKVLPDEFTRDPERLARFEREARVLASLDHQHVASIHGFEDIDGVRFLVMQLADGEDLSDRLTRGPVPVNEAIAIARQIAEALEAAHEQGIVHRDLKPANIKISEDGNVNVLDFGLAKAFEADESNQDISNSPTMIRAATNAGVILGTAAYMSPEQARGKKVDKRADIWAFGVVLWEMLVGARLFSGDTLSDTLAAVLTKRPDLSSLPSNTPRSIRWILERCLEQDPKKRLRDIGEARLAIERSGDESVEMPAEEKIAKRGRPVREYAAWAIVAMLVALVGWLVTRERVAESTQPTKIAARLAVLTDESLQADLGSSVVVSPDGRVLVFAVVGDDGSRLVKQQLNEIGTVPIPGTEGATSPFFSPDGEWIAFFSGDKLKKVAVSGGAPLTICNVSQQRGGTWGESGFIVFTGQTSSGLSIVSEDGGDPELLTTPDGSRSERSHRWPAFLPGGKAVLFMAQMQGDNYENALIEVVSLEDRETKVVHSGGAYPRYARSGHLVYSRAGVLFALPFDLATFETKGTPKPVLQEVLSRTGNETTDDGTAHYEISSNGVLVYRQGLAVSTLTRIAVFDRESHRIATSPPNYYFELSLSPDGSRVAAGVVNESGSDVWVWDIARNTLGRLTFHEATDSGPVWSPDSQRIAYTSARPDEDSATTRRAFVKSADGSGDEEPLGDPSVVIGGISSWSPDGKTVIINANSGSASFVDTAAMPLEGEDAGKLRPILSGPAAELYGDVSPDGRWLAYYSNESGRPQIYVQPFPGPGGKWQVSVEGGRHPIWVKGGSELVWSNGPEAFMTAAIERRGDSLVIGQPTQLDIEGRFIAIDPLRLWDVSDDGETFVALEAAESGEIEAKSVVLVTNWFDELERLFPEE